MLPVTSSVKLKVPVPPTITFLTTIAPCLVFVIAQVVVSPVATVMPVAGSPAEVVPSSRRQLIVPAAHPLSAVSERRYVPLEASAGTTLLNVVSCVPDTVSSAKAPLPKPVGVKLKVLSPPTAVFTTRMAPRFVLVKVQVTISPAATSKVARRVARLPLLLASSQVSAVRSQPGIESSVAW